VLFRSKGLELHKQIASNIKAKYKQRAELASTKLTAAGFKFTKPDAPFYVFPKLDGLDGDKFTLNLLDKGVAVAPGSAFGDYREHFRISLTAPDDQIEVGLNKICEAAAQ
jgi:aspartate/methionine/tyrosine aminotransferase